jgi:hypothetical protein
MSFRRPAFGDFNCFGSWPSPTDGGPARQSSSHGAQAINDLGDDIAAINRPTVYGSHARLIPRRLPLHDRKVDARFAPAFESKSVAQSRLLAAAFAHCPHDVINLRKYRVTMDGEDGLHLTAGGHHAIAQVVAEKIRTLLPMAEKSWSSK